MKSALFVGVILGVTMIGSAQIPQNPPPVGGGQVGFPGSVVPFVPQAPDPSWTMTVDEATEVGAVTHFKKVNIRTGAVRLLADEADFNRDTGEMDLRGNVHMLTRMPDSPR